MDVIVEGKITAEEGLDEVLQTIVDLKTVAAPVLRINCLDARFQGKIGFAQGGYIVGAKIDETGELGYPAVRKLLLVRNGNYAILDPEKQVIADINQTLWIDAEKMIRLMPYLPETPDSLVGISPSPATTTYTGDRFPEQVATAPVEKKTIEKASVSGVNSKARQFDSSNWRHRYATILLWVALLILLTIALMQNSEHIWPYIHNFIK